MKPTVLLIALFACDLSGQAQVAANDFFVATDGNDAWSGLLAEPNAARTDGPLATIPAAAARLRGLKQHGALKPVTVWIRGGTYHLERPLSFTPSDSGPITYAAYRGEQPVFDAGHRIQGWHEQKLNGITVWVADVQGTFRSLFVNGQRRPRAHLPKQGFYRIADVPGSTLTARLFEGTDTFRVNPGEVRNWKNLHDVEIRVSHYWNDERMPIDSVDEKAGLVKCTRRSIFALKDSYTPHWAEYWVDNVFEALSDPGEWYLDRKEGKLYYVPEPGESMDSTIVVAAGAYQFLRLDGSPDDGRLVTGLTFRGLTFRYSDWIQPDIDGKYFDPYVPREERRPEDSERNVIARVGNSVKLAAGPQCASHVPGAISLAGAEKIAIVECRIEHAGYWGIALLDGCRDNTIERNTIVDIGAGGIKVDGANYPSSPKRFSGNNRIVDNVVRSGGRVFQNAAGILITHGYSNLVAHNEVSDLYQSGIACGWDWSRNTQVSRDNLIEYNNVFHLGQKLSSDMGGVYVLGVQPGTIVRNNLIHDIQHRVYGGWGIYTDNSAAHIVVENNVVYDVSAHASYTQGIGGVNREITVRNNIFAFAGQGLAYVPESYEDKSHSAPGYAATYERNIFISNGEPVFVAHAGPAAEHPHNDLFLSDLNLFWDVSGKPPIAERRMGGGPLMFADWKSIGSDLHSMVADPNVQDWKNRDFTLSPDSPAFSLGFLPIDISGVGPRPARKGPL